MKRLLNRIEQALYQTTEAGRWVGYAALGVIVLLTVLDITLRYVFNRPLGYAVEVVELALCIVVFIGIIVCTAKRAHVIMDILLTRLPQRGAAAINSFMYFFATVTFGVMTWRFVIYAIQSQEMQRVSMMLKWPYYPFVLFSALCGLLTTLLFLSQFIHFVAKAVRKWN